jgi:multicomponent Na+:H+ antiporter subunit G
MDGLAAVLVITGATLMAVGALGLIRLPDVYNRTNAVAKASSLGLVCLLLGVLAWMPHIPTALTLLTAVALQLLTAPISGFAVGRAAHRSRAPLMPETGLDELRRDSDGRR